MRLSREHNKYEENYFKGSLDESNIRSHTDTVFYNYSMYIYVLSLL